MKRRACSLTSVLSNFCVAFWQPPPPTKSTKTTYIFFRGRNIKKCFKYVLWRHIFSAMDQRMCCWKLPKKKVGFIREEQCRMHITGQIQLKANAHDNTRTWWSRCSVSACSQGVFSFASICICFEKITECLTALNIPNSWHATETMNDETMYFFPLFCEEAICSTTKEHYNANIPLQPHQLLPWCCFTQRQFILSGPAGGDSPNPHFLLLTCPTFALNPILISWKHANICRWQCCYVHHVSSMNYYQSS